MYQEYKIDLSAAEIAVLGSLNGTDQYVQLVAGGDASIEIPVLDGISFNVIVAGKIFIDSGENLNVKLRWNGNDIATISPSATNATTPFLFVATGVWHSSTSHALVQSTSNAFQNGGSSTIQNPMLEYISISSPSNFQFKIAADVTSTDANATVTITEFRILPN